MNKNVKIVSVTLSLVALGTLTFGLKHKSNPIEYINKSELNQMAKTLSETPTGLTSKKNAIKPKQNYEQTLQEMNKNNIDKKNINNSELNSLISNNSTFFLQILSSNNGINNIIKKINDNNNIKTIQMSSDQLKNYNQNQKNKIIATPGTVLFYKGGLITGQFDPNFSHDQTKLQQSYTQWVSQMIKEK